MCVDIQKDIKELLGSILDIPVENLQDDAAPGAPGKWDSLKHLQFFIALEEDFEIVFSDDEMVEMIDLPSIVAIVKNKISGE
jgi:acyl carrier protein